MCSFYELTLGNFGNGENDVIHDFASALISPMLNNSFLAEQKHALFLQIPMNTIMGVGGCDLFIYLCNVMYYVIFLCILTVSFGELNLKATSFLVTK